MPKSAFKDLWETIKSGKTWRGEVKNLKKDGGYYWVDAVISADHDENGNITGYSAIRLDITSQKEAQYLASHDFLTSLPNKAKFEEIASHAIKVAKQDKTSLAILFIIGYIGFKFARVRLTGDFIWYSIWFFHRKCIIFLIFY